MSYQFSLRVLLLFVTILLLLGGISPGPVEGRPEPARVNRCGCFEESAGVCKCLRRSTCGCPGQCEPLGCEEKRQKDLARRMEEELRKIRQNEQDRNGAGRAPGVRAP